METLYGCCCGLDVHAQTIVACVIRNGRKEVRTFGAMTAELLQLSDWLQEVGCTHVAMESTGVYWKPVFNILEGVLEVILVNAQHIKAVPGRKTDVKDCEWIADLLRHGLLRASFIPPLPIRELRELVRYRAGQVKELATTANRIQKVAESGNIKLGQVASDVMGVSGRRILRALAGGATTPELVSELVQGKLKRKQPAVCQAVNGRLTAVQRWVLTELLDHYEELEAAIDRVKTRIQEEVSHNPDPWVAEAIQLLDTIPGVGEETAQVIVAEIGVCMDQFPSAAHLAQDLLDPKHIRLTERAEKASQAGALKTFQRWFKAMGAEPSERGSAGEQLKRAPIVMAAVDVQGATPALLDLVRETVRRILSTEPGARLACVSVMKTARIGLDELTDQQGNSLHVKQLVGLKHWARPISQALELEDTRLTFHVLEAPDAATAIVEFAQKTQVDHIIMGARGNSALRRYLGSVSSQVVAQADCTVTVVRVPSELAGASE